MPRRVVPPVMAGLLLFALAGGGQAAEPGRARAAPPLEKLFGGPFSLVDHEGRARTEKDFRGRFMLLTFGYTHCPDVCPTNLNAMAAALDMLGAEAARITPVFISVDPARDTPAVLKRHLENFGPRFVGLTGSPAQVLAAARAYRVHIRLYRRQGHPGRQVDHGSLIYLIGPDGRFRTLFPYDTPPERMARVLRRYLSER
jgi:protein SCO1/2